MKQRNLVRLAAVPVLALLCACRATAPSVPSAPAPAPDTVKSMNRAAERYVRLVLAVGQHDADYVDAYARWREFARLLSSPRLPSGLAVK